jgi:hypothetical protein
MRHPINFILFVVVLASPRPVTAQAMREGPGKGVDRFSPDGLPMTIDPKDF